jgi:phosphatidylglycerol lysyltransferase
MQVSMQRQQHTSLLPVSTAADSTPANNVAHLPLNAMTHSSDLTWQAAFNLTSTYGYNSVASFALDPKNQFFFARTGEAFISYVLWGDVVLVIGDPIGPAQELPGVLAEFLAFWRARHKAIAFWQVREELLDLYRSQKLRALKIGEDAIIDVQDFTLKGGKMANVRTSAKRAEKSAMHIIFYKGAVIPAAHRDQMARISRAWLAHKGGREMGFSMGRFEPGSGTSQFAALAFDLQGVLHAFITFIPIYGRNGWSLDLLRRDEQAIPGTMELLIVRSLEYFKTHGNTTVSLGLAPLNNNNQNPSTSLDRFCSMLLRRSNKLQQFQNLTAFKQKFQPTWENRYLIFSHPLHLLPIGLALNAVHQQY